MKLPPQVLDETVRPYRAFGAAGVVRRNEVEPLGEGFDGSWISNPVTIIHMVETQPAGY
jgi:hypothetical protein